MLGKIYWKCSYTLYIIEHVVKHAYKSKYIITVETAVTSFSSHHTYIRPRPLSAPATYRFLLSYLNIVRHFFPSSFCRCCSQPQVPSGHSSLCGITLQKWWMCSQPPPGTRNLNSDPVTAAVAYFEKYISSANPFYCSESSADKSGRRAPSLSTSTKINQWNEARVWFLWRCKKWTDCSDDIKLKKKSATT